MINPFLAPRPKDDPIRAAYEPICCEHMEGFGDALEGRVAAGTKRADDRVRANTILRLAEGAGFQAGHVARAMARHRGMSPTQLRKAMEAATASTNIVSDITAFVTQSIHTTLDIFPRLLANRLVSVQPLTRPSGYVFFLHRVSDETPNRRLDDLSAFSSSFGEAPEGDSIPRVKHTLSKQLVEVKYKKLAHEHSHEMDVALSSQYNLDIEQLGDLATAEELAWEVDREVITDLQAFAETDDYFDPDAGGSFAGYTPSEQKAYAEQFMSVALQGVMTDMTADIYRQPNWFLGGTAVIKWLRRTPTYTARTQSDQMADQNFISGQVTEVGFIEGAGPVWHDPQLDNDLLLCGYVQPNNPFYAGYIFSPFGLASILTAQFMDPDNLLARKARALAFAKKGVRHRQFKRLWLKAVS